MTNKTKGIIAIVSAIVLAAVGIFLAVVAYNTKLLTAFEYVKKKGAVQSNVDKNLALYKGYLFFNNNRVTTNVEIVGLPIVKGTYNKEFITWDNGVTKQLSEIFE